MPAATRRGSSACANGCSADVSEPRSDAIDEIARRLVHRVGDHPLRVAVDGLTGAGKSIFSEELTAAVTDRGGRGLHLSTDDFHHRVEHRRRDPDRARGYRRDAFDLTSFGRLVLEPLGPAGDRRVVPRLHDLTTDEMVAAEIVTVPADTVVVVDGTFLQDAPLHDAWDVVIYLETPADVAVERAVPRDTALFGSADAVRDVYATRYHAACRLYVDDVDPVGRATVVVDNTDLDRPIVRWA